MASGSSEPGALLFWTSLEKVPLSFPFCMLPCHQNQVSDKVSYRGQRCPSLGKALLPSFSLLAALLSTDSLSACLPLPWGSCVFFVGTGLSGI